MKKSRPILSAAALIFVLLILVSCAASRESINDLMPRGNTEYSTVYPSHQEAEEKYLTDKSADETSVAGYEQKIIKSYQIDAETKELDKAIASIESGIAAAGGYVESSTITGTSITSNRYYPSRTANYILRIPASGADGFLTELSNLLNITKNTSAVSDVTLQYYDLESRISVLENERRALEELYDKADNIEYILKLRSQLNSVIQEIESKKTQLNLLKNKISYSTIYISITEVVEYSEKEEKNFIERIADSFSRGWSNYVKSWQNLLVSFVYGLPALLTIAVIFALMIWLLIFLIKRSNRKAKNKESNK